MAQLLPLDKSAGFPDETLSPKKKAQSEWCLAFAQAALAAASNMAEGSLGYSSRELYREWWEYAQGKQDIQRYIDQSGIDPQSKIFQYPTRLPYAQHYYNLVVGMVEKAGYKIRVRTIDPQATMALKAVQAERKAKLMFRQVAQSQGAPDIAGHPDIMAAPGEPDDLEGLSVMAMGEKLPVCADAEDVIRKIFNDNHYSRQRRQIIQWLFIAGAAVTRDDTDYCGVTTRVCELGDVVLPYCRYGDFRDANYFGEIQTIPISSIPELSEGKVKKADLEMLYSLGNDSQWFTEGQYNSSVNGWWSRASVQVLDLEIISTDTIKRKEWKNRLENTYYGEADEDDDKKEERKASGKYNYADFQIENVYRVKWIIGTDIVFDYGKAQNIKRDPERPSKAQLSFHVVAPNIHNMMPYSRMASIIPMIDDMHVNNIRRRWTLNRAIPSGYAIDYDSLEDIDLNGGGKAMSKLDVLNLFSRTGHLPYRQKMISGQYKGNGSVPVTFLKGGVGEEIVEYSNQITYNVELIRQALGLNDVTDGSTVASKNLNSTNEAMATGTNNSLSDIYFADKQMTEMLAQSVLIRAQDLLREDEIGDTRAEDLEAIIGSDSANRLANAPKLNEHTFGITLEDAPSQAEEQDFNDALNLALQANQISVDERFMAKTIAEDNILQAQIYLSYRVRKNKESQQQQALQQQQSNSQAQIQSAQAAEQAKQQTIQVQMQADIQKAQAIGQITMQTEELKGGYLLEKERIAATGRVESAFTQAKERDTSNMRDNTSKLIKEGHDNKVGVVNIPADLQSRVEPVTSDTSPALPKSAFSFLSPPPQPAQQQPQMPAQPLQTSLQEPAEPAEMA